MARLVLVGLSGVGKTTVARAVAKSWQCQFIDTDDLIADAVGLSAPQYLRNAGEATFRQHELKALIIALSSDVVVATGGGVVCTPEARNLLRTNQTLWLDCGDEEIVKRLGEVDRPLLGDDVGGGIERMRHDRSEWYREVSSVRIDAAGTLNEVLERIRANVEEVRT